MRALVELPWPIIGVAAAVVTVVMIALVVARVYRRRSKERALAERRAWFRQSVLDATRTSDLTWPEVLRLGETHHLPREDVVDVVTELLRSMTTHHVDGGPRAIAILTRCIEANGTQLLLTALPQHLVGPACKAADAMQRDATPMCDFLAGVVVLQADLDFERRKARRHRLQFMVAIAMVAMVTAGVTWAVASLYYQGLPADFLQMVARR